MSRTICWVVLLCVIAEGLANPATSWACTEATKCEVSNVDITPCADPKGCNLKQNKNATIQFEFVPEFAASELETGVYWNDIAFAGLDADGCKATSCPVAAGVKQTFSYNLKLTKKNTAKGRYEIKWKLWNKSDSAQLCCFYTTIKIK